MENLEFIEASGLNDDMYVVINQDVYPRSAKVKLSELKNWILQGLDGRLKEIDRKASIGERHCALIGPARRW